MDVVSLIRIAKAKSASDLHMSAGSPAMLRVHGILVPAEDTVPLTPQDMQEAFNQLTSVEQKAEFAKQWELDFGYSVPNLVRVRCNAAMTKGYHQPGDASHRQFHSRHRYPAHSGVVQTIDPETARHAGHQRAHRQRQVHYAGGDDQLSEPAGEPPGSDHRRPD